MSNIDQTLCICECGGINAEAIQKNAGNFPAQSSLNFRFGTHSCLKTKMLKALSLSPALEEYTKRDDDDNTVATLDAWATVLDVISFYQERIINEGYLRPANERLSVLELARHVNYILNPGVSASTYLAFTMNEVKGAPLRSVIPEGTKVQSVPEQAQLPQVFETTEEIEARVEWNNINLLTKERKIPEYGDKEIYLEGMNTELNPGDGILIIGDERISDSGNENWDFRKVKSVIPDPDLDHTKITWHRGLGDIMFGRKTYPAKENVKVYALRLRANLFGYNAPDFRAMTEEIKDEFNSYSGGSDSINKNKDWKDFKTTKISNSEKIIHLDAIYPKILKGGWLVMTADDYYEVYKVTDVMESSRKDFTLTSKTLAVTLSGENLKEKYDNHVRDTVIFAQNEELQLAEKPYKTPIKNKNRLVLEKLIPDLTEDKIISLSGKRHRIQLTESLVNTSFIVEDDENASRNLLPYDSLIVLNYPVDGNNGRKKWFVEDEGGYQGIIEITGEEGELMPSKEEDLIVKEIHTIKSIKPSSDPTVIMLQEEIVNYFDPLTVSLNGNVVGANHGETKKEVLGSGDGSLAFQKFNLKQTPLTYNAASTASGIASSLEVRVNDILWQEVSSFYGKTGGEKIYITSIDDEGVVSILFGDGITGSRLPTGSENIHATYRIGIGTEGLLNDGQLSMLMTPQLGISEVTNPISSSGAADRETLDNARQNTPLTALTLDRIVSAKDFEDFTRAFTGIGKARVDMIWNGEKQVVFITIASEDEGPVAKDSELYEMLSSAIKSYGPINSAPYTENYTALSFSINARIAIDESYQFETVKEEVIQTITDSFSFSARDFGQDVTPSEVIAVIQEIEGVVYTDLEKLNNEDPHSQHFRLSASVARIDDSILKPAELLTVNTDDITITEILK